MIIKMNRQCTVELFKEDMKFSAGHFTVFSATERERLHGHNFRVRAHLTAEVDENGLTADYRIFKKKLRLLCEELDEYFLLPANSPYLSFEHTEDKILVRHYNDEISFLKKDIKLLPIKNTTVEEFSYYLVSELIKDQNIIEKCKITEIEVKVGSGDGQIAGYIWKKD